MFNSGLPRIFKALVIWFALFLIGVAAILVGFNFGFIVATSVVQYLIFWALGMSFLGVIGVYVVYRKES